MKLINRILTLTALTSGLYLSSCEEVELGEPNIATSTPKSTANFLFVNASPDAPALDFYVNNQETAVPTTGYNTMSITSNAVLANTNIRAKASSGSIGGVLGSSDLIFRAGSTNSNNLQAADKANYTIFVVDSIDRPKPLRTLNAGNFGDVTYYSSRSKFTAPKKVDPLQDTVIELSENNSIVIANLLRKYNGGNLPSFVTPIGTVPLGSSDPGGLRFYVLTDALQSLTANQASIRFVPLIPEAGALHLRLNGGTPISMTGAAGVQYPLSSGGGFTPSVGSRSNTSAFTKYTTLIAGTPNTYTIELSTNSAFTDIIQTLEDTRFLEGKNYTIYAWGTLDNPQIRIIQHN